MNRSTIAIGLSLALLFAACAQADETTAARAAAEWVVAKKGIVQVTVDGKSKQVRKLDELPAEPFLIREVNLQKLEIKDSDLARFAELKSLGKLILSQCPIGDAGLEHLQGLTELHELGLYQVKVLNSITN